jgi:hypothetical protein
MKFQKDDYVTFEYLQPAMSCFMNGRKVIGEGRIVRVYKQCLHVRPRGDKSRAVVRIRHSEVTKRWPRYKLRPCQIPTENPRCPYR